MHGERSKERKSKYNQAAAEEEHVVVRGMNKGKDITRTVIERNAESSMMVIDLNCVNLEHHEDRPLGYIPDDDTLMDESDVRATHVMEEVWEARGVTA